MSMSETFTTATTETTSGLLAEAVGGLATIVLAIIGLAGTSPAFLLAIATIVFGAALLIEGTSIATDYAHMQMATPGMALQVGTGGLASVFLAGITGIILGVLALLGISAPILTSAAVIVFGSALLLSASSTLNLHALKVRMSGDVLASDMMSGTAAAQALAGIAAVVLGILAVAGTAPRELSLVALLVLGAGMLTTGNGMNNAMISMFRPSHTPATTTR
jgi:hypothetical protein